MRGFARAFAIFGAASAVTSITQVAKGKLGALLLGTDGMGALAQVTNVWSLLYTVSGLGFYNGVVQRIARASGNDERSAIHAQFSSALVFLTSFSLASVCCALLASRAISELVFADGGARAWLISLALVSVPFAVVAQVYAGLLSGLRLVKKIVTVQIASDIVSVPVLAICAWNANLAGAVVAFSASSLIKLAIQLFVLRRGLDLVKPPLWRMKWFEWQEITPNFKFGLSSIALVSLGIISNILVAKAIIEQLGMHANGIFSAAWKVCSLYFGALYASAGSFYFPSLAAARDRAELVANISQALTLYMFLLPPIAMLLMVWGSELIALLFTREFADAGALLLFFLFGDILRILAETINLAFLATRRLFHYNSTYIAWAIVFVSSAYALVPSMGLPGIGVAYVGAHAINALLAATFACQAFGRPLSRQAARAFFSGLVASGITAALMGLNIHWKQAISMAPFCFWLWWSWCDPDFRRLFLAAARRVKGLRA